MDMPEVIYQRDEKSLIASKDKYDLWRFFWDKTSEDNFAWSPEELDALCSWWLKRKEAQCG